MTNDLPNQYSLGNLPGIEPQTRRVFQDLVDQLNFLTGEVTRLKERDLVVIPNGAARKQSPVEGIITIPYREAGGQDGNIRISKDGVIVSYVNPAESFFPYVNIRSVGNSGASLTTLHTVIIPPGSLANNGDYIEGMHGGSYAANANIKRVVWSIGGSLFEDTGLIDVRALGWVFLPIITRLTSTSIRVISVFDGGILQTDSAGANTVTGIGGRMNQRISITLTVPNLDLNSLTLLVQGQGTNNDDVTSNLSILKLYRPRTVISV